MTFNALTSTRWGTMLYHRHDFFIGRSLERYGEFSPDEANMLAQLVRPGDVVIDGGANQGVFTVLFGQLVGIDGVVYAIEPQRLTYQVLCGNAALNSLLNIHAIQAALGSSPGRALIPLVDPRAVLHSGGVSAAMSGSGEPVQVITVDSLGLTRLDLLKLDIEGHERAAIRGARQAIARFRPVIYVENDKPEHFLGLISDIRELGYQMYWHCPPFYSANNWKADPENLFGGVVSANMLCLPADDPRDFGLPAVTDEMPRHLREMWSAEVVDATEQRHE
jgi:FkbM family methyltransferase